MEGEHQEVIKGSVEVRFEKSNKVRREQGKITDSLGLLLQFTLYRGCTYIFLSPS